MKKVYIFKTMKVIVFLLGFYVQFSYVSHVLVGDTGYNFQQSAGFFEEPKDSLDAVYIGASPTFTSWVAPLAYKKYGITMRTFANNAQPFISAENLLKIARKRQSNAVYLIAINGLYEKNELSVETAHRTTDFLPHSLERAFLIYTLCHGFQYSLDEYFELLFPIIRYHSRWNSLSAYFFHRDYERTKGGFTSSTFLNEVENIADYYCATTDREPLPGFTQDALVKLLAYCKNENVKVVFVLSAQYRNAQTVKWYNTIIDEVKKYNYPIINEMSDFDEIGLDDKTDFYNDCHTNIHGALKITDYLAQYLIDNYGFEDKRGGTEYADWDEAYEKYIEIVRPYLTEEELEWLQ